MKELAAYAELHGVEVVQATVEPLQVLYVPVGDCLLTKVTNHRDVDKCCGLRRSFFTKALALAMREYVFI